MEANGDKRTPDQHALAYAENIIATLREPFVVLDKTPAGPHGQRRLLPGLPCLEEETEGRFVYELGNGQWDIPQLRALLAQVLSNSHPVEDFEVEHAFPALGQRTMLLNARRFPPETHEPELVLLAIEDITDNKRAEEALRKSEKRQQFILDSIPQKIATTRPNGDVDYFNPQWTEFTGLSFEKIRDWGWKQFIHPDDLAEHVSAWRHSINTGEPFEFESRFRRADGEYRWHISRALPMRDEAGRVIMWAGSNTDVHDIKLAEMALMDSEIRYRRLFETAKDGILILDTLTGRITDANPFMSELLGTRTSISWARNCGRSACSATNRPMKPPCENCNRRATFVTNTCRWKPTVGCGSRSRSSPTPTKRTSTASFSATFGTSPNAVAWKSRFRSRR